MNSFICPQYQITYARKSFGVLIGNRTRIKGSTSLCVNRYTISTIFYYYRYLYVGGFSVIPDLWLESRAIAYKRLERRLRNALVCSPTVTLPSSATPTTLRSARRASVRAKSSCAAKGVPPETKKVLIGGNSFSIRAIISSTSFTFFSFIVFGAPATSACTMKRFC